MKATVGNERGERIKAIGYTRLSKEEKTRNQVGLQAQRAAVEEECAGQGWQLLHVERDNGVSGTVDPDKRPGLARALGALESGEANVLVVSRLDRLTRSLLGFADIVERAQRGRWRLVVVDQAFDLGTSNGRAMAGMLAVFAQWERDIIADRTRDALAQVKRRTPHELRALGKKPIGRPVTLDPQVRRRIRGLRTRGRSYAAIAEQLNKEGVPTAQGGKRWYAMSVRAVAADFDPAAPKQRRQRRAA